MSRFLAPLEYPLFQTQRIYWLYLLTALVFATIVYLYLKPRSKEGKRLHLLQYLFPKSIYLHKSAITDYFFFYINTIFQVAIIIPLFVGSSIAASQLNKRFLDNFMTSGSGILPEDHPGIRDTSELMVVNPKGIRNELLGDNRNVDYSLIGSNGISGWANIETGQQMLKMKISAGLNQINQFIQQQNTVK